jgi:ubiquinone/menaquinone biosynthesis C-methylase UbiE
MLHRKHFLMVCLLVSTGLLAGAANAEAQLAARETDEWIKTLERPERVSGQKVDQVISRLNLKPGMVVADIGAGAGLFSLPIGRAVAPGGKVYAVDIQQGLLDHINQRAKEQKLTDIQTVLGGFDDPKLPARDVDLAFINDVLHHIEHRAEYLKALASYLKPTSRVAIIEMNKNDPNTPHKDNPELLVSREEMDQWMAAAGLRPVQEYNDLFPGAKWFIIYGRK